MNYDCKTLPNGLRIIGEPVEGFRSVSVGLWIGTGSHYEREDEAGLSHFLEHMVFKGTKKRTTREIATLTDAIGGHVNAFTAKECTCFYAKVVDEHMERALDLIADLVTEPIFDAGEMEKEKGVVIEEINMSEDTPEDLVHELLMTAHYGDQPLSKPILGTEESVRACTPEIMRAYWTKRYRPQNAVLSVAGHYDWEELLEIVDRLLGSWSPDGYEERVCEAFEPERGIAAREKEIEQIHICLGFPGQMIGAKRAYEESLYSNVYGGAMSSRLFQRIREEEGAAYTVYSASNPYMHSGMQSVYAATSPECAERVLALIEEETQKLANEGMTEEEFVMAREQMKTGVILAMESMGNRMQSNGRRLLLLNTIRSSDEVIERINALRREDINQLMREALLAPHSIALVGKDAERIAEALRKTKEA